MWVVAMLVLVAERDLGAALLVFGVFLALLYLATGELAYVLGGLILLGAGGSAAAALFPHVAARIDIWQRPFADELRFGASYQVVQGLYPNWMGSANSPFRPAMSILPHATVIKPFITRIRSRFSIE